MLHSHAPRRLPTVFIPHGGGPCFFMEWSWGPADTWKGLEEWLRDLPRQIDATPSAIVVVSAHWEAEEFTVTSGDRPSLLYDYSGFPEHTYRLRYDAEGSPALATRIQDLVRGVGLECRDDADRGFDHGVFVPLLVAFPHAEIPVVELSLRNDLDAAHHLRVGEAIEPLREEGVLIVGSGMSFHNMQEFGTDRSREASRRFDAWLTESLAGEPELRSQAMRSWKAAPGARESHPREEHLIPLMVTTGAAGRDRGRRVFSDEIMGATISAFCFGDSRSSP